MQQNLNIKVNLKHLYLKETEQRLGSFFASVGVTSEDFKMVCDYANIDYNYMREFAFKVLKSGEIEYTRKRINAVLGH